MVLQPMDHDIQSASTHGLPVHRALLGLWNKGWLQLDQDLDDTENYWHGHGFKDCNRDIRIVFEGYKWHHFFPNHPFEEHVNKYRGLTNGTIELSFRGLCIWLDTYDNI